MSKNTLAILISLFVLFCLNCFAVLSLAPNNFVKQLISWIIGLGFFLLGRQIDPQQTRSFRWWILLISCLFLLSPILLNHITRGSRRWLEIGPLSIQPSEITKPWLMLFLANSTQPLWLFLPIAIVLLQPDLGSAISIFCLAIPIIIYRPRLLKLALIVGFISLLISPLVWTKVLHPYQRSRITYFLNPNLDPLGKGYNLIQSQIAIGAGGFWGRGFRQGTQSQLLFLPEKHTDFAFAAISEQTGLIGIIILILAYFTLIKSLFNKAYSTNNQQLYLFTLGIAILIWFQTFINIGMNIGILPVTGIPLPFISVGGSSVMALLFALGIVFSS